MNRDKIVKLIKKWNKSQTSSIYKLTLAEDLSAKQKANALSSYAAGTDPNDWIAMLHTSFSDNGKKAILLTRNKIYSNKIKHPINLEQLDKILYENNLRVWLFYRDGNVYIADDSTNLGRIYPLLQEIVGCTQELEAPKSKYEYIRQNYAPELKRRISAFVKDMSEECEEILSPRVAGSGYLKNALQKNRPDLNEEDVLALIGSRIRTGSASSVVTMEGIFGGGLDDCLYFDGLKQMIWYNKPRFIAVYDNNFIKHYYTLSGYEYHDLYNKFALGIVEIYEKLHEEIQTNGASNFGLNVTAGWSAFSEKLNNNMLDTYKNSVFVSSTFRDMHFERDILHEKVQPSLNTLAEKYGQSLSFCDLRWGVNTEELDSEEGAKKVLIVCLDEIERCDPYMLILLGDRYGWIPNDKTVKNALEGRSDFSLDELEKSVTALEIEFGALSKHAKKERIFVYFREMQHAPSAIYSSEDEFHAKKLAELKDKILQLLPNQVKSYTLSWNEKTQSMDGIDAFAEMVTEDIGRVMEKEWIARERQSPFEEEIAQHWSYAEKKAAQCYARDSFLQNCLKKLELENHLMAIQGPSGCGKSTLMGALSVILQASNAEVLPLFSSHTEQTDTSIELVQHIVYFIEDLLEETHLFHEKDDVSDDDWLLRMNKLTEQYSNEKEKPIMILIDAVDQLSVDSIRNNLKFIPENITALSSKVYMIISCLDDFALPAFPLIHTVPLLTAEDKPAVIAGILRRNRRELDTSVIDAITKKTASDSPLYLMLLIQRLLMMNKNDFDDIASDGDDMSAITKHQLKIVAESGDTISEICRETIHMAAERIGNKFVKTAVDCISASRHGLRAKDLEGILTQMGIQWNRLEFSIFINYVRNIFVLRENGSYDFSHKIIRQELERYRENTDKLHIQLFNWLKSLPTQDELRRKELLYHCMNAGDTQTFITFISELAADDENRSQLVKDIIAHCRKDNSSWLTQLLQNIYTEKTKVSSSFFNFIAYDVYSAFGNSKKTLSIRKQIASALLEIAKHLSKTDRDIESKRSLGIAYNRLGTLCMMEKDKKAFEYYQKALNESIALAKEQDQDKLWADIAVDYQTLADAYITFGGADNREQALNYYQQAVQSAEKVCETSDLIYAKKILGWSYKRLADFYIKDALPEKAYENYSTCASIQEQIVEAEPTDVYIDALCDTYNCIAKYLEETERSRALEYYEKIIHYRERLVRNVRTLKSLTPLALAYSNAAGTMYALDKKENSTAIIHYAEKCIPIFEEIIAHKENKEINDELAERYYELCMLFDDQKDEEHLIKLEGIINRTIQLKEEQAKLSDSTKDYIHLSSLYAAYVTALPTGEYFVSYSKRAIEVNNSLYKRTRNKIFKQHAKMAKLLLTGRQGLNKFENFVVK